MLAWLIGSALDVDVELVLPEGEGGRAVSEEPAASTMLAWFDDREFDLDVELVASEGE